MAINWNQVIFNQLTLRGIYGREMYETWYKMTVMLESGLDISPRNYASVELEGLRGRGSMRCGRAVRGR